MTSGTATPHICFAQVCAAENPDLFWGVRGGGNFGIITCFEFQLHPVGPVVLGGMVIHPLKKAKEALKFYYEYSRTAPDELSADTLLLTSPEGERVLAISACYVGPVEHGEHILRPLREFGPPLAIEIGPIAYTQLQAGGDALFPTGLHYYWKAHFLRDIGDDAIEAIVAHFAAAPSPRSVVVFQQFGGAVSRVGQSETAFSHRDAQYDFFPTSIWTDGAESEQHIAWARRLWDTMRPFSTGGVYVNDLGEEAEDQIRAAYGENYGRLVTLKNKYDPSNFFRLNQNIRPTGVTAS